MPRSPSGDTSELGATSAGLSRRRLLKLGAAGSLALAAGGAGFELWGGQGAPATSPIGPSSPPVMAAEAARFRSGRVVHQTLRAAPTTVDIGGTTVHTLAFNGSVPGPEIRVSRGDELRVRVRNELAAPTTVHWHGLALRNDMDGVPDLTMSPITPCSGYEYRFVVPDSGTYWFHPHVGVQLDTGLQGALIVEDPHEPVAYDDEHVLILDDWTDALGMSPSEILRDLGREGMDMDMNMSVNLTRDMPLGSDTGDVMYPAHLINGRLPDAAVTIRSAPGRRLRLRLINAGADTAYRFAVGGHRLRVTHADGYAVRPIDVDTLVMGMGERYDVVVTVGDGAFPIVALPEGKPDPGGRAILRTAAGAVPSRERRPDELDRRLLEYADLKPQPDVALPPQVPDRELGASLTMVDGGRQWVINGAPYGDNEPLSIFEGERVRVVMTNDTTMFHPMHVHGHSFALVSEGQAGPRKDTVNVLPKRSLSVDIAADNPGQWLTHCHNVYHQELGMATVLSYRT